MFWSSGLAGAPNVSASHELYAHSHRPRSRLLTTKIHRHSHHCQVPSVYAVCNFICAQRIHASSMDAWFHVDRATSTFRILAEFGWKEVFSYHSRKDTVMLRAQCMVCTAISNNREMRKVEWTHRMSLGNGDGRGVHLHASPRVCANGYPPSRKHLPCFSTMGLSRCLCEH